MKIVFITPKLNFITGGGTTDEYDLTYRTLLEIGHEVAVATAFSKANRIPHSLPYRVIEENISSGRQLSVQRGVYFLLKKYESQADFFFVDGQVFLYGAGAYRVFGGAVPVVAYFNRELMAWPLNISTLFPYTPDAFFVVLKKRIRWLIEHYLLLPFTRGIDLFAFTSPFLERSYADFGMQTKGKSFILGDAFDFRGLMKKYGITEESYRKRNKQRGPYTMFYSSRMAAGKGFDLLLSAFSKLKHKEDFRLLLGGTGPEEPFVRKMISDFGIEDRVELLGWMSKDVLYARMMEADFFVQARWRTDMTSMSLQTAMLFGLPSVLPRGGGLEWVACGSAIYFEDGNVDDLAVKIEQLAASPALRAELSRQCYIRMDEPEMNHRNRIALLEAKMKEVLRWEG